MQAANGNSEIIDMADELINTDEDLQTVIDPATETAGKASGKRLRKEKKPPKESFESEVEEATTDVDEGFFYSDEEPVTPVKKESRKIPAKAKEKKKKKSPKKKSGVTKEAEEPRRVLVNHIRMSIMENEYELPFHRMSQTSIQELRVIFIVSKTPCYGIGKLGKMFDKKDNYIELSDTYQLVVLDEINTFSQNLYQPKKASFYETWNQAKTAMDAGDGKLWCSAVDISDSGKSRLLDVFYIGQSMPRLRLGAKPGCFLYQKHATECFFSRCGPSVKAFNRNLVRSNVSKRLALYFFYGYFGLPEEMQIRYVRFNEQLAALVGSDEINQWAPVYWKTLDYEDCALVNRCLNWFRSSELSVPSATILRKVRSASHLYQIYQNPDQDEAPRSLICSPIETRLVEEDLLAAVRMWPRKEFLEMLVPFTKALMMEDSDHPVPQTLEEAGRHYSELFWIEFEKSCSEENDDQLDQLLDQVRTGYLH